MIKKKPAKRIRGRNSYLAMSFEYLHNLCSSELWTNAVYGYLCKHIITGQSAHEKAIRNCEKREQRPLCIEFFENGKAYSADCHSLDSNIDAVCEHLNLSDLTAQAFRLSAILSTTSAFSTLLDGISYETSCSNFSIYSVLLDEPEFEVQQAFIELSKMGLLAQSKAEFDRTCIELSDAIRNKLITSRLENKDDFIQGMVKQSEPAKLKLADYEEAFAQDIASYMHIQSLAGEIGVNILLHGQVGVGKTELARLIAQQAECALYEVLPISEAEELDEFDASGSSGKARANQLKLINYLFKSTHDCMLVIDECEDLFVSTFNQRLSKEEIHQILATNVRPCIWITNHVDCIPESALRRFKLVYQLPNLSKKAKLNLVDNTFRGLSVSPVFKKKLAGLANLSPAVLTSVSQVTKSLGYKQQEAERLCDTLVDEYLIAAGHKNQGAQYQAELAFDMNMVNLKGLPDTLKTLKTSMEQLPNIRVLMHGPAGTGKTSFVHYLADEYDFSLQHVRCSDVLDKFVGGSEQNVARIFEQAMDTESIILLDEVDSLLMCRQSLDRSHEVQLVNELLTQVECFKYPLFAATNYYERLDKAVLRRFDYKLLLDYLTQNQVISLFKKVCGIKKLNDKTLNQLALFNRLTPGDFAIIERRKQLHPDQFSIEAAIAILAQEQSLKQSKPTIGFIN